MAPLTGVLSDRFLWVWVLVQVHVSECVYERERESAVFYSGKTGKHQRRQECGSVKERERHTERCALLRQKIQKKTDHFPDTTKSCNVESSQLCVFLCAHANKHAFTQVFAVHTQISGFKFCRMQKPSKVSS